MNATKERAEINRVREHCQERGCVFADGKFENKCADCDGYEHFDTVDMYL